MWRALWRQSYHYLKKPLVHFDAVWISLERVSHVTPRLDYIQLPDLRLLAFFETPTDSSMSYSTFHKVGTWT